MKSDKKRRNRRMNDDVKVLPSDIWLEILRRIPAADLVPLKAVCKTFHRLISDDDFFARLHLNHHLTNAKRAIMTALKPITASHTNYDLDKRIINVRYDDPIFVDLCSMPHPSRHYHRVIDSYHGLLLVEICGRVLLCNPITRSFRSILPSDISRHRMEIGFWKIAYDNVSKQYKVFGLELKTNRVTLCVLDGKSNSPRKMGRELITNPVTFLSKSVLSVLVNGNVHFLVTIRKGTILKNYVISANVDTEEVKVRSCSRSFSMAGEYFYATNGTFYHTTITDSRKLQVWVLEGVENENPNPSWMIKHLIDIDRVISTVNCRVFGMFGDKALIGIVRCRRQYPIFNRLILRYDWSLEQLCQYDLSSEEFEEVTVVSGGNNIERGLKSFGQRFHIVEHIDTLIRP